MRIFTGDLKPDLEITLSDADDDGTPLPVDLSDADSVKIIGRLEDTDTVLFNRDPSSDPVVDGNVSIVTLQFQEGDTNIEGHVDVDVVVTWPTGKPQTWRSEGFDIYASLVPTS